AAIIRSCIPMREGVAGPSQGSRAEHRHYIAVEVGIGIDWGCATVATVAVISNRRSAGDRDRVGLWRSSRYLFWSERSDLRSDPYINGVGTYVQDKRTARCTGGNGGIPTTIYPNVDNGVNIRHRRCNRNTADRVENARCVAEDRRIERRSQCSRA